MAPRLNAAPEGVPYSRTEATVMAELARAGRIDLGRLRRFVDRDAGQLARIVRRFQAEGLAETSPAGPDGGSPTVELTGHGHAVVELLDRQAADRTVGLLAGLRDEQQKDVVTAMAMIRRCLSGQQHPAPFAVRGLRPGDLGWVLQRHCTVHADEFGPDQRFEAQVAAAVAAFASGRDPVRERGWIAELEGVAVGCVFCTRLGHGSSADSVAARLGLLLVEPSARGLGVGRRLVQECIAFARGSGYRQVHVGLQPEQHSAARIVRAAGFREGDAGLGDWILEL